MDALSERERERERGEMPFFILLIMISHLSKIYLFLAEFLRGKRKRKICGIFSQPDG